MFLFYYFLQYILGIFVGLIITGMIYPALRIFPTTIGLISLKKIKKSALITLVFTITFWSLFLIATFFVISYFKTFINVVVNFGFIFGFMSVIFFGWLTPSTKYALRQDYLSFFDKYLDIPDDVSPLHLETAKSIIQWIDDSSNDIKQETMNFQLEGLSFSENDEVSVLSALHFLDADSETIQYATEMLDLHKELWQEQIELEESNIQVSEMRKSVDMKADEISTMENYLKAIQNHRTKNSEKMAEAEKELEDMIKGWYDETEEK